MSKLTREIAQADLERAYQAYQETLAARSRATRDRSLFDESVDRARGELQVAALVVLAVQALR